jgi:F-type H+-transporting ATPase subunit b
MDFAQKLFDFVNASLNLNLYEILIQLGGTLLLFIVVKRYFWKPITKFIETRQLEMRQEFDSATEAKRLVEEELEATKKAQLELKTQVKDIIQKANEQAKEEAKQILDTAKADADHIRNVALEDIEREVSVAKAELKNETIAIAIEMVKKVLGKDVSREVIQSLTDEVLDEVSS